MEASTAALVAGVLLLASTVQLSGVAAAPLGAPLGAAPDASGPLTGAPSLDFCTVSRPVHLVAGSAESSVQLQLSRPTTTTASLQVGVDGQPRPCRVHVSAPASNLLSVELVPLLSPVGDDHDDDLDFYDGSSSSRSSSEVDDDDDVDAKVDRDADNGDVASSSSANAAAGNMGLLLAGLLQQDAARKGSSVNASCTLSLYVEGEVAWSVDLCDADAVLAAKNHIDNIPHNFSLVWTPPKPSSRRRLRAASILVSAARKGVPAENFCSVTTVRLAPHGLESAMALQLRAPEGSSAPCRVNIAAPTTHVLSLLLVAAEATSASTSASSESAEGARPSCGLSLLLGCTSEYWAADLCDAASAHQALNFTEVFPHNVTLVWTPPPASQRRHQLVQTVLLTAIGKGKMCSQSQFFPCWRRPRAHPLCVSTELACDGYHNCPMDGNDEDPTVCRPNSKLIEVPGQEKENEGRSNPDAKSHIIEELLQSYYLRHHHANNHSRRNEEPPIQSSPDTLSNYGPWGYLMLGMLGCGALLMLCGLWECCCRQPKTTTASCPPSHTPTTVLMPPAGVLALDSDLEDDPSRPPAYDDLDPPPAYGALFPGQPKDDAPPSPSVPASSSPTSLLADATFPHMDADDVSSLDAVGHGGPS